MNSETPPSPTDKTATPERKWQNRYIAALDTKPDYIITSVDWALLPPRVEYLNQRIAAATELYWEIGSGSGGHLIDRAERNPHGLYLGCELRYKRVFRTVEKAEARGVKNLLMLHLDARRVPTYLAPASLSGVYLNFPDPWDKKRWAKHRLATPEFLQTLHALLKPGGFFAYKTDHPEAFRETVAHIQSLGLFLVTETTDDLHRSAFVNNNIVTEFERLFLSQGKTISYIRCLKP